MGLLRDLWRVAIGTDPYVNARLGKLRPKKNKKIREIIPKIPFISSFVDNVIAGTVKPVPGSVVYCGLAFNMIEHSGIYIGRGRIAHLEGSGYVTSVTLAQFLARLDGLNLAMTVYVSSSNGKAVGSSVIAARARSLIGTKLKYCVLTNNCHSFTASCMRSLDPSRPTSLGGLKAFAERHLDCDEWRAWDTSKPKLRISQL